MSEEKEKSSDWVSYKSLTPEERQALEQEFSNAVNAPVPKHIREMLEKFAEWENNQDFIQQLQEAIIKNHG
tara:strand:- start:201 stop:413 length:213 start_codon:yes stop_codon:yes gene_type:complete